MGLGTSKTHDWLISKSIRGSWNFQDPWLNHLGLGTCRAHDWSIFLNPVMYLETSKNTN